MSVVYLKVKIKSLQAEAKIIKEQERKYVKNDTIRNGLTEHRKHVVRNEQRATLIAYGFLRGKKYKEIEPKEIKDRYSNIEMRKRVLKMVVKYSPLFEAEAQKKLDSWFKE